MVQCRIHSVFIKDIDLCYLCSYQVDLTCVAKVIRLTETSKCNLFTN